jgi:hypothetical protein
MRLLGLRCTGCGSRELIAVDPAAAGEAPRAWCRACWLARFGVKAA